MPRELDAILQELETLANDLDSLEYVREASDLRSLSSSVRTGGEIRVRKVVSEDSSNKS